MSDLTKAIQAADWSGVSIGNKVMIQAALAEIERLRAALVEIVRVNDECAEDENIGFDPSGPMMAKAREALQGGEAPSDPYAGHTLEGRPFDDADAPAR